MSKILDMVRGVDGVFELPRPKQERQPGRTRVAFLRDEHAKVARETAAALTEEELRNPGDIGQKCLESLPFGVLNDPGAHSAFLALYWTHVAQRIGSVINAHLTLTRPLGNRFDEVA